jgi:hypothetical protein
MVWVSLFLYASFILVVNLCLSKPQRHGIYAKLIYLFSSFILIFLLLFRGNFGVDWEEGYLLYYESASNLFKLFKDGFYLGLNVEPGFQFYLSILKSLDLHENWIPAGFLIFILYFLYLKCIRYNLQFVVVIALFTLSNYLHFYEQIRMAVVYSIGIFSFIIFFYHNNKIVNKLIIVSALVHYISLFYYLILYSLRFLIPKNEVILVFQISNRIKTIFKVGLLLLISFFSGNLLFYYINLFFEFIGSDFFIIDKFLQYSSRIDNIESEISYRGSILLVLMGFYFILFYKAKNSNSLLLNKKLNVLLFMSVSIFFIFNKMPIISHRLLSMLLIPSLILLGNIYFDRTSNLILFFFIFLYVIILYFNLVNQIGDYISII